MKMLLRNNKEEKIHLQYCNEFIFKNPCINEPVQFKPMLFKG